MFKRFMYATAHPVMLFMTAAKIDCPVIPEHCHFILDQEGGDDPASAEHFLEWGKFYKERPVAFCVGCVRSESAKTAKRFEEMGFRIVGAQHKTDYTAFIARNQKFIYELEQGMDIG
ncbi:MAG: hypothetical protein LAP87_11200 [Acidobacteriia bacterium]|nr:hypothetical protein [Terriglobia bacterium]